MILAAVFDLITGFRFGCSGICHLYFELQQPAFMHAELIDPLLSLPS